MITKSKEYETVRLLKSKAKPSKAATLLAWVCLCVSVLAAIHRFSPIEKSEPDRYFHLYVAKQTAERGLVRTMPQADDLGWAKSFPEKEFLFHAILGIAFKIGGESAVVLVPSLLVVLVASLVFLIGIEFATPWAVALITAGLWCGTPEFVLRLSLLRPHLLGMACFWLSVWATFSWSHRRAPWGVFAGFFLFSLSYHALYLPGSLLICLFVSSHFGASENERSTNHRMVAFGLAGLIAGAVANPYFPENMIAGFRHLLIAFQQTGDSAVGGVELNPYSSDHILAFFGANLVLIVAGCFYFGKQISSRGAVIVGMATLYMALLLVSPRACEYLLPWSALLGVWIIGSVKRPVFVIALFLALAGATQGRATYSIYKSGYRFVSDTEQVLFATKALPADSKLSPYSKKVFNCDWPASPMILYARPDLKFVDILDPSFLKWSSPIKFQLRKDLLADKLLDPFGVIRGVFNSDYVICSSDALNRHLAWDPHFTEIRFAESDGSTRAFSVQPERLPAQVNLYERQALTSSAAGNYLDLGPKDISNKESTWEPTPSAPYVHLEGPTVCAAVRPQRAEIVRRSRSTWITLGGGRNIRLWLNGEPLFWSPEPYESAKLVQTVIKLPRPLSENDQLLAIVCSAKGTYRGFSLSLFRDEELTSLCHAKGRPVSPVLSKLKWHSIGPSSTCLGPLN